MKGWLRWSLLTWTLVISPAVASAERAFWEGAVPPTPQARTAQAKEWLEGFRTLDRQIPTLSPAESAWLKLEYDDQIASAGGKFTDRAIAASSSTEYHKRLARRGLESILAGLSMLSGSPRLTRQGEIVAWTRLVTEMIDPQFWQSVNALRDRKVVSGALNGVEDFFFDNHVMWARIVLERVVVPMLEGSEP